MFRQKISRTEIIILIVVALIFLVGFVLVFTNVQMFQTFTVEDGMIEWLTVIALLLGSFTSFSRTIRLWKKKRTVFLAGTFVLGLLLFLAAGEEISWGQRVFGIESSDYFKQHNTQGETNFHNLVINGVRVNRWIFSFLLTAVLGFYVVIMPLLYNKKNWMKSFVDYWGIPLPKIYQGLAFVILFIASQLIPHEKRAELLECGTAFLLFLVVAFPVNEKLFVHDEQ